MANLFKGDFVSMQSSYDDDDYFGPTDPESNPFEPESTEEELKVLEKRFIIYALASS